MRKRTAPQLRTYYESCSQTSVQQVLKAAHAFVLEGGMMAQAMVEAKLLAGNALN